MLDFDIDGVVIKVDDTWLHDEIGTVAREPRWATAYKFPAQQAETTLEAIEINVGRTGSLNPLAILTRWRWAASRLRAPRCTTRTKFGVWMCVSATASSFNAPAT